MIEGAFLTVKNVNLNQELTNEKEQKSANVFRRMIIVFLFVTCDYTCT